ncbi:Protein of unknown function (DUF761 [Striga hermonthica]|uniref:DUF4408 domain-containing protein n=1 Tax=Striga hermonthica TaxID=68872 RepID=A0A9N7RMC4_STRHE|nr:Protein of unknown function (DUF761 [Striga hermonthica]
MGGWILSMKILLISAGVVSLAVGLRFAVPAAADGIPALWSAAVSWLRPPYLYLIINGIIITIAASSRFQKSHSEQPPAAQHLISVKTPPTVSFEPFPAQVDVVAVVEEPAEAATAVAEVVVSDIEDAVVELRPVTVDGSEVGIDSPEEIAIEADQDKDVFVDYTIEYRNTPPSPSPSPPPEEMVSREIQLESLFPAREKPLVTSRFAHRKPNRSNPEAGARALRVTKTKKHETLESTWKMITEGRHVPLTRHLKKPEDHGGDVPAPARIGKEPSPGQEELNRRVEAFINKFNEEMRMQRQESMNQFMEMINRGL